ncbi:50S ribosomal protein L10, partial [Candidatus Micrarchaeota archaeon]|nr:50S ribosomal protein L10 [Candidatus Micrarchaeota archaeon]
MKKSSKKPTKEKKERIAITKKKQQVTDISGLAKNYPTIGLINLRNLPDDLLQFSKKKLREEDETAVKIAKITVLKRVLESLGLKEQADKIHDPSA